MNAIALGLGFPLLTLGVITGVFWAEQANGKIWTGTTHEVWSVIAWAIYAVVPDRGDGEIGATSATEASMYALFQPITV